jgi:hypothetical protein
MANALLAGNQTAQLLGAESVEFIVVYTNFLSSYNTTSLLTELSNLHGLNIAAKLTDMVIYYNQYSRPIIYANTSAVRTTITYHDPVLYVVHSEAVLPYTLVFNQAYSRGWILSINGTRVSADEHVDLNGINEWNISVTGNVIIRIYYQPQSLYSIAFGISLTAMIGIFGFLFYSGIKKGLDLYSSMTKSDNTDVDQRKNSVQTEQ